MIDKRYFNIYKSLKIYLKHYKKMLDQEVKQLFSKKFKDRDYTIYEEIKIKCDNITLLMFEIYKAINSNAFNYYNHIDTIKDYNLRFNNILN